ncbi:hypothetical protein [Kitasatospora sp. McL0602]|uniref:hypothetical protein n=1 Tax=Kitasatospora sp. McL0602 TaxID=3439530 RepID=UPI003F88C728
MASTGTTADLIPVAGTALALLRTHPTLPVPRIVFEWVSWPGGDKPGGLGFQLGLHGDTALADFEQWREALGLDTGTVSHGHRSTTAWLITTFADGKVPVQLTGYYNRPSPDDGE